MSLSFSGAKANLFLVGLTFLALFRINSYCEGSWKTCTYDSSRLLDITTLHPRFSIIKSQIEFLRKKSVERAQAYLPSPHSELLLGMTVGLDLFGKLPQFKEMLLQTGTIHVVVVSGYNISLVYGLVWTFLGSFYKRNKLLIGVGIALFYALLSGFEPPVIRSWVMGSLAYFGKVSGRAFPVKRLLFVTALLMLLWCPGFLFSLSFQLSFAATLSLILFSERISRWSFVERIPLLFREDFVATLAAQVLVLPLIWVYFRRISLVSFLVNTLILWTVPLATVLGGIFLLAFPLGDFAAQVLAFFVYIPLDMFVVAVKGFSRVPFAQIGEGTSYGY